MILSYFYNILMNLIFCVDQDDLKLQQVENEANGRATKQLRVKLKEEKLLLKKPANESSSDHASTATAKNSKQQSHHL